MNNSSNFKHLRFTPVTSSNVLERAYDPETQTLYIQFKDKAGNPTTFGSYANVTPEIHDRLIDADSFGGFLRANIVKLPDAFTWTPIDRNVADEVDQQSASDDEASQPAAA